MMATPCNRIVLRIKQFRRRYVQRRMLRELGWRRAWDRAYKSGLFG